MRQGRGVRWCVGALGFAALLASAACGPQQTSPEEDSYVVTVTVQTATRAPATGAVVTVWIVDADLPGAERAPIELGTAATDAQGTVRFAYTAFTPPYVCGYEVKDASAAVLAAQAPMVTNELSTPGGYVNIVLP